MTIHKSYPLAHFKALDQEGEGVFEAIVSVFGNVDLIGDRVVKGAFTKSLSQWKRSGDPIPVIFDHQWGNLDAHVGLVTAAEERPEGLYVKAQLDMDEPFAARLWKKMNQRAIKEFSFAYDVVKEKRASDGANDLLELNVIEVGPTLKGMNPATQLVGVKKAVGTHSTGTSDGAWDGPANRANLPSPLPVATARAACAWIDESAVTDGELPKGDARFIHHFVSSDGKVGDASTVASSAGIGVLNGGRTGTTIPGADRAGVYAHLAKHIKDSGADAPELKAFRKQYIDGIEPVEGSFEELQEDLEEALRDAEGDGYVVQIVATFADRLVYSLYQLDSNGYANWDEPETYQRPYTIDEQTEQVTLGDKVAVDVQLNIVPDEGDGKSRKHQSAPTHIQSAHDALVKAGATCTPAESGDGKSLDNGEDHKVKPEDQRIPPRDVKLRAELLSL